MTSEDGIDEIAISGDTRVIEVAGGRTEEWFVAPEGLGLERAPLEAIAGGTPQENAAVTRAILDGDKGPARDVAVLNAGAAMLAADAADDLADGIAKAARGDRLRRRARRPRSARVTHRRARRVGCPSDGQARSSSSRRRVRGSSGGARRIPQAELEASCRRAARIARSARR